MSFLDSLLPDNNDINADLIWQKARFIDYAHESLGIRLDYFGNKIQKSAYGDRQHPRGWERDNVIALNLGGLNDFENLYPLHWKANVLKSNKSLGSVLPKSGWL